LSIVQLWIKDPEPLWLVGRQSTEPRRVRILAKVGASELHFIIASFRRAASLGAGVTFLLLLRWADVPLQLLVLFRKLLFTARVCSRLRSNLSLFRSVVRLIILLSDFLPSTTALEEELDWRNLLLPTVVGYGATMSLSTCTFDSDILWGEVSGVAMIFFFFDQSLPKNVLSGAFRVMLFLLGSSPLPASNHLHNEAT